MVDMSIVTAQLEEILTQLDTKGRIDQLKKISRLLQYQYSLCSSGDVEYQKIEFNVLTKQCNEFLRAFVSYFENDTYPVDENFKLFLSNIENFFTLKPFVRKFVVVLDNYMAIILDPSVDFWTCYELVSSLESILATMDREMRLEFFNRNPINVYKLMDILGTCGDYSFQEKILKLILKLIPEGKCDSKLAYYFFPDDESLQEQILTISESCPQLELRTFLNAVNSKNTSVFSIKAKSVYGDTTTIIPPEFYGNEQEIWVDFNIKSESVSIQCALKGISSDVSANVMYDTMFIYKSIINNINIKSTKMRQVILVHLSGKMSMSTQYSKEFTKKCRIVKIVLDKSLYQQELVNTYLPKIFGGLYLGDTNTPTEMDRLRKLKIAPVYQPLSINVKSTSVSNKTSVSAKSFAFQLLKNLTEEDELINNNNDETLNRPPDVLIATNPVEKPSNILVPKMFTNITKGIEDISIKECNIENQSRSLIVQWTEDRSNLQTQEDTLRMLSSQKCQEIATLEAKSQAVLNCSRDIVNKKITASDQMRSVSNEVVDNMKRLKKSLEHLDIKEKGGKEKSSIRVNFPTKQYTKMSAPPSTLGSISEDDEYLDAADETPLYNNTLIAGFKNEELSEAGSSDEEIIPKSVLVPKQTCPKPNQKPLKTFKPKNIRTSTKMLDLTIKTDKNKLKEKKLRTNQQKWIEKNFVKTDQFDPIVPKKNDKTFIDSLKLEEDTDVFESLKLDDGNLSTAGSARTKSSERFESEKFNGKCESPPPTKTGIFKDDESKEISDGDQIVRIGEECEEKDSFETSKLTIAKKTAMEIKETKSRKTKSISKRGRKFKRIEFIHNTSEESSIKLQTSEVSNLLDEGEASKNTSHIQNQEVKDSSIDAIEKAALEESEYLEVNSRSSDDSYNDINLTELSELTQEIKERERIGKDLEKSDPRSNPSKSQVESPPIRPVKLFREKKTIAQLNEEEDGSGKDTPISPIEDSEKDKEIVAKSKVKHYKVRILEDKLLRRQKKIPSGSIVAGDGERDGEINVANKLRVSEERMLKDQHNVVDEIFKENQIDEINEEIAAVRKAGDPKMKSHEMKKLYQRKSNYREEEDDSESFIKEGGEESQEIDARSKENKSKDAKIIYQRKKENHLRKAVVSKTKTVEDDQSGVDKQFEENQRDEDSESGEGSSVAKKEERKIKIPKYTEEDQSDKGNIQSDQTEEDKKDKRTDARNTKTKRNDQIDSSNESSVSIFSIKKSRKSAKKFEIFHDEQEAKVKGKLVVKLADISEQILDMEKKKSKLPFSKKSTNVPLSENILEVEGKKTIDSSPKKPKKKAFQDSTNIIKEKSDDEDVVDVSEEFTKKENIDVSSFLQRGKKKSGRLQNVTNLSEEKKVNVGKGMGDEDTNVSEPQENKKDGRLQAAANKSEDNEEGMDGQDIDASCSQKKNTSPKIDGDNAINQTIEVTEPLLKSEKVETPIIKKKRGRPTKTSKKVIKEADDGASNADKERKLDVGENDVIQSEHVLKTTERKKNDATIKEMLAKSKGVIEERILKVSLMRKGDRRSEIDEDNVNKNEDTGKELIVKSKEVANKEKESTNIDEDLNSNSSLSKLLNTPLFKNKGKQREKKATEDAQKTKKAVNDEMFKKLVETIQNTTFEKPTKSSTKMSVKEQNLFATGSGLQQNGTDLIDHDENESHKQFLTRRMLDKDSEDKTMGGTDLQQDLNTGVEQEETNCTGTVESVGKDLRTSESEAEEDAKRQKQISKKKKRGAVVENDLNTTGIEEVTSFQKRRQKKSTKRVTDQDQIESAKDLNSSEADDGNDSLFSQKRFPKKKAGNADHKDANSAENDICFEKQNAAKERKTVSAKDYILKTDVEKDTCVQEIETGDIASEEEIEATNETSTQTKKIKSADIQSGVSLEISVSNGTGRGTRLRKKKKAEVEDDFEKIIDEALNNEFRIGGEKSGTGEKVAEENSSAKNEENKRKQSISENEAASKKEDNTTFSRTSDNNQERVPSKTKKEIETLLKKLSPEINENNEASDDPSDDEIFERPTQRQVNLQKQSSQTQKGNNLHSERDEQYDGVVNEAAAEQEVVIEINEPNSKKMDPFDRLFNKKTTLGGKNPQSQPKVIPIDDDLSIVEDGDTCSVVTKNSNATNRTHHLTMQYINYFKGNRKKGDAPLRYSQSESNLRGVKSSKRKLFNPTDLSYLEQLKTSKTRRSPDMEKRARKDSDGDMNTRSNKDNPCESLNQPKRARNDFNDITIEKQQRRSNDPYDFEPHVAQKTTSGGSSCKRAEELFKEIFGKLQTSKKRSRKAPYAVPKKRSMKTKRASKSYKILDKTNGSKFKILQDVRLGEDADDCSNDFRLINARTEKLITDFEELLETLNDVTSKLKKTASKRHTGAL